ncbi:MAG: zinc-ribbon domain-containing protein [Bacilli bacterium]|nr:zinc-ribbon domain-containing protein [Bacilli bacterium]MDD4077154.1 zinc-ribbon domain-containing protein [Bacilli bacterium]
MKYCIQCGNELLDHAGICPNCGTRVKPVEPAMAGPNGVTLGIVSIVGGLVMPIVGWICGGIGFSQANKVNNAKGKNLNLAGLIVSTINFILALILFS